MSRESAKREAQRWLERLNLQTKKMQGETIDLTEHAKALRLEPHFRAMVVDEARKLLKARGVLARVDISSL